MLGARITVDRCEVCTSAAGGMCGVDKGRGGGGALHACGCRARRGKGAEPCCGAGECLVVDVGVFGFVNGWRSTDVED